MNKRHGRKVFTIIGILLAVLVSFTILFPQVTFLFGFTGWVWGGNLKNRLSNEITLLSYRNLGGNYYIKNNIVYWITEVSAGMFGPMVLNFTEVEGSDNKTFKSIDYNLAKDKDNIYVGNKRLLVFDATTNESISNYLPVSYTYLSKTKGEQGLNHYDLPDVHIIKFRDTYYFISSSLEERPLVYRIEGVDNKTFKTKYGEVSDLTRRGYWPLFRYLGEDKYREYILIIPDNKLHVRSKL